MEKTKRQIYEHIYGVVYSNRGRLTAEAARHVLDELYAYKGEWVTYSDHMEGDYRAVYVDVHHIIAQAHIVLKEVEAAIEVLTACIDIVEKPDSEYEYQYELKSDLYEHLARIYSDINRDDDARQCLRNSIYYLLVGNNHTHYSNREVYSFREVTKYLLESLKGNNITLTDPSCFNDPLDPAIIPHFDYQIRDSKESHNNQDAHFLELLREIYCEVKIRCFTRIIPLEKKEGRDVSTLNDEEREINLSTMWAYYAKDHTGICVEYVLPDSITMRHNDVSSVRMLGAVEYRKQYNPQKQSYNVHEAFFVKSIEWAHEVEARLVYFNRHNKEKFATIPIPQGTVKAIYFGLRTSEENKQKIFDAIVNQPEIKVYQMVLSNDNMFLLKPLEIERPKQERIDNKGCCPNVIRAIRGALNK